MFVATRVGMGGQHPGQGLLPRRRRRRIALLCLLAVALVTAAITVVSNRSDPPTLLWDSNFDGPRGSAADGWQPLVGHYGHVHNSLECASDSRRNSALDGGGNLVISARRDPGTRCGASTLDYTSARLQSVPMHRMNTGYLEIRAKMALGSGMWNALWLVGSNYKDVGWPRCGELDVAEVVAKTPKNIYATAHGPSNAGRSYNIGNVRRTSAGLERFHTYSMDWTRDSVRFAYDDSVYMTLTREKVERQGAWVFDHDFDLLLSLAVGGDWPGRPTTDAAFPQAMTVDYVRVWSSPPAAA